MDQCDKISLIARRAPSYFIPLRVMAITKSLMDKIREYINSLQKNDLEEKTVKILLIFFYNSPMNNI